MICSASALNQKQRINRSIDQVRYKLGVRGKTKDGHDCYVHYDKGCTPLEYGSEAAANAGAPAKPFCHPFDPTCTKFAAPPRVEASKPGEDGIILPDPDCDPELDYNCRLRRATRGAAGGEEAAGEAPVPRFDQFLRGVISQHK
ncbi:uncharacterized protein AB9W97_021317 [Spinachia spinachia]